MIAILRIVFSVTILYIYIYIYTRGALQVLCGDPLPETPTGASWTYLMFLFEFGVVLDTPQGPTSHLLQKSLVFSCELRPSSKSTFLVLTCVNTEGRTPK